MRKSLMLSAALLSAFLAGTLALRSTAHCGSCGMEDGKKAAAHEHHHKKDGKKAGKMGHMCPMHLEGVQTKVTNTDKGVVIEITAADETLVEKIQLAAAKMSGKKMCEGDCEDCDHHKGEGKKKQKT